MGWTMLAVSACFSAFEVTLENRLFRIDPDLTALGLQQAISIWKMILVFVLFIASNFFEKLGEATGSDMESLAIAVKNLNEEKSLYTMMFALMFFNALAANLGMQIVKNENAVFKQSAMLLPIPVAWIVSMIQHEEKSYTTPTLIGQMMLVTSVLAYMWWDR